MLSLYQKIQRTESLQRSIDRDVRAFKIHFGLDCITNCSECCKNPEIIASPLEFLPFAWHANRLGQLEVWADKIEARLSSGVCVFYRQNENLWGCQIYPSRGFICRLFGFSAVLNKLSKPVYGSCRVLNKNMPDKIVRVNDSIASGAYVPVLPRYYQRLFAIDPTLSHDLMHINQAAQKAIELVWLYGSYRECA